MEIGDNIGHRVYGFAGLRSSADLTKLWFAVPNGKAPPATVYVELHDRRLRQTYKSNFVLIGK